MSFIDVAAIVGGVALEAGASAEVAAGIGAVAEGALTGSALGAATSALTGGDVGQGALFGGLGGGLFSGVGSMFGGAESAVGGETAGIKSAGQLANESVPEAMKLGAPNVENVGTQGIFGANPQNFYAADAVSPYRVMPGNSLLTQESALNGELFAKGPTTIASGAESPWSMSNIVGKDSLIANPPIDAVDQSLKEASSTLGKTNEQIINDKLAGTMYGKHNLMLPGVGATIANYIGANKTPSQATPPGGTWDPWKGWYNFNPRTFQAQPPGYTGYLYTNPTNTGYLQPRYAEGGIASLNPNPAMMSSGKANTDFMGQDAFPMSQQKLNFYNSPSQMPTSAQQAMASYEPATNPLTGEPLAHFADGGIASLGGYSDGGRLTRGPGDGMSDSIPASIAGKQEARLADGEFVVPADVVSHLGNGSTDAGAKNLYAMMDKVRKARTGRKSQGKQINPAKYMPA